MQPEISLNNPDERTKINESSSKGGNNAKSHERIMEEDCCVSDKNGARGSIQQEEEAQSQRGQHEKDESS